MKRAITSVVFVISFVSLLVLGLVSRVQANDAQTPASKAAMGPPAGDSRRGRPSRRDRRAHRRREGKYFRS